MADHARLAPERPIGSIEARGLPAAGAIRLAPALVTIVLAASTCGGTTEDTIDSPPIGTALVTTCVRLASCETPTTHRSVSECIAVNSGPLASRYGERIVTMVHGSLNTRIASIDCILAAGGDCEAVRRCVDGEHSACDGGRRCEGSKVVACSEGSRVEIDCTLRNCEDDYACDEQPPGATCIAAEQAACGYATCNASFGRRCDGDTLLFCANGVVQHRDCRPRLGRSPMGCRDGECVPLAPECASDHPARCEGSDVVSCIDGRETRTRCGAFALPMTCDLGPCSFGTTCTTCIPSPRLRCQPGAHVDRCEGTALVYCDGEERSIDCRSIGFTGCTGATCTR